ncbi:glycoside hydrolase domain-containing protein [Arthrobacter sp. Leaf137]|uniref:glycoside hydrolase domain-containing protein n=1 Tax=Arthrobacter sp. Leaf137 TaxID=1736271 RepID=UPI000A606C4B|nr:glycoside hydrolase domain-containing protein [Arthrobacter sp. Leaf137]
MRILSGSLWCKGKEGDYSTSGTITFASLASSIGDLRSNLGLSVNDVSVDVKLMAFLLSMDAEVIPFFSAGTPSIRDVQRWLNGKYSARKDFSLVPCDGIFSRQVQTATLFALQYEFGMADGVANGNFGPGTRDGLRSQASVKVGSTDGTRSFVRLFQAIMRFNGLGVPFTGTFDATTSSKVLEFQSFMELPSTGAGDYTTWCNLLVSSGDTSITTKGFDTNKQLSAAQAMGARSRGYTHVGRYTVGAEKFITSAELDVLRSAGLRLFPIHQRFNNSASTMTYENGRTHGREALERCRALGFPEGSLVFFTVDFDPVGEVIQGPVSDFFTGVNDVMNAALNGKYAVGVYGTRNVCQVVLDGSKASGAFVAGMSTGFSGNMGFPMPAQWHYNQIIEVSENLGGITTGIDHVVVSSKASSVDLTRVVSPPVELEAPENSPTGFDIAFEWVVRAEVACELDISAANTLFTPIASYKVFIPEYILDWLRTPKYSGGALWPVYTPTVDANESAVIARGAARSALGKMTPAAPASARDVAHWAATVLGYVNWGVPTAVGGYGLGDLGGWPLDLLQVWGEYDRLTTKPDLMTWMTEKIGGASSAFGYDDVVADADAWLVAKALKGSPAPLLSDTMRQLYKLTASQRIKKFYAERFGSSETNIANAFKAVVDGIDVGPVQNFPLTVEALKNAASAANLPTQSQAETCGRAYARAMIRLGG